MKKIIILLSGVLSSCIGNLKHHHHSMEAEIRKTKKGAFEVLLQKTENRISRNKVILGNPYRFKVFYRSKDKNDLLITYKIKLYNLSTKKAVLITMKTACYEGRFSRGQYSFFLYEKEIILNYENHQTIIEYEISKPNGNLIERGSLKVPVEYSYNVLDDVWNI